MNTEKEKYDKIYRGEGKYTRYRKTDENGERRKKYGHENNGKKMIPYIYTYIKPQSIIDIGCGHNDFCKLIRKKTHTPCVGVDISCSDADIIAPSNKIPVENNSFDLLTAFDVMEHIPETEIDASIKEFRRIANRFIFQISLRKSPTNIDGENLHPLVREVSWWIYKLEDHGCGIFAVMYVKGKHFCPRRIAKRVIIHGEFLQ